MDGAGGALTNYNLGQFGGPTGANNDFAIGTDGHFYLLWNLVASGQNITGEQKRQITIVWRIPYDSAADGFGVIEERNVIRFHELAEASGQTPLNFDDVLVRLEEAPSRIDTFNSRAIFWSASRFGHVAMLGC